MTYKILLLFLFFTSMISCKNEERSNEYFYNLTNELSPLQNNRNYILKAKNRELEKYKKTNEKKYLIASKYVEFLLYREETNPKKYFAQIPLIFQLLHLNNNEYSFVSMACYFHLALQYEKTSPELAMKFLNSSIAYDKEDHNEYFIAHLYHAKGRFLYTRKDYSKALYFFKLSLNKLAKNESLYRASMYNNFSLVHYKTRNYNKAIEESKTGIKILQEKKNLTIDEINFLFNMKRILSEYLISIKNYTDAEEQLIDVINFYKTQRNNSEIVNSYRILFALYKKSDQKLKNQLFINDLKRIEPKLSSTMDKITANNILQEYFIIDNDIKNVSETYQKLNSLNKTLNNEQIENLKNISSVLDSHLLTSINEKYNLEMTNNKKINTLTKSLIIAISIILISITLHIIKKHQKKIIDVEDEKKLLSDNLSFQKQKVSELQQNIHLKKKTENIILENLKKIKNLNESDSAAIIREMILTINNLGNIDRKKIIDSNYESNLESKIFNDKLLSKAKLTKTELRLCGHFRMHLSAKEIATIENTSPGTIRVYKTKIKNKLNLSKDQDLNSFLSTL